MANFAAWLMALVLPLGKKLLVGLGIGVLTYEGLSAIAGQVQTAVAANWGAMPVSVLQILTLAGFAEAVGIELGALAGLAALVAVGKLGKLSA